MQDVLQKFGSGRDVKRLEDDQLLRGQGRYTDDFAPSGMGRLAFLRSPYPHAEITSLNTDAARACPGVRLVLTHADLAAAGIKSMPRPINFKRPDGSPAASPDRHLLAAQRVRYVGEPVALVVADTEAQARTACEAIEVMYEPLPHAVTLDDALAADAPRLADEPDNLVAQTRYGDADATAAAFAQAAHVVRMRNVNQRLAALTIEPRSVLAYVEGGRLTIRMSSQMPTAVRNVTAALTGIDAEKIRVVVGDVGGGFGMKTGPYPEDILVAWAAHTLQAPVKWVAERSEEFLNSVHGRDIRSELELALDDQGRILAMRLRNQGNVGAYPIQTGTAIQLMIGPWVQTSVYHVPLIDFQFQSVLTNTAPTGAYRGAGRPEAIYNMERLMDEAARQTGIDRVTLRRRNMVRPDQMPYTNAMGQTYDTGNFERIMDAGLKQADWNGFEARAAESQQRGRWRGIGLATFLEWTGGNALEENVSVNILSDGTIEVYTAVNPMGQGIATSLAQLVVDVFGVPISQVKVCMGDTDKANGFGSAGSRSLFTGGSAVSAGSQQARDKAQELAAEALEAAAADLVYEQGAFSVRGTDVSITLGELAAKQDGAHIAVQSSTSASGPTWPNGCHVCEVELDPDTGEIEVVKYTSVNDVGRVINPTIVRGQLDGGAVQGMGQALCEAVVYDADSGQLLTGSLMDYTAPRADIMQVAFDTHMDENVPCKNNLLGVKGVGELGTIGATPATVSAVANALQRAGRGDLAPALSMPLTSARMWQWLQTNA